MDYWKDKDRKYAVKKRYGISLETYQEMLASQGGKCAICDEVPSELSDHPKHRLLHIDHDHATGKVRQLLCNGCNRALGFLRDDPSIALKIAAYLERHK